MNKKMLFIFIMLGFFIFPRNTFAQDFSYQSYDYFKTENRTTLKNKIMNTSEEFKTAFLENSSTSQYFILGNPFGDTSPNGSVYTYVLATSQNFSYGLSPRFSLSNISFATYNGHYVYYFDDKFNLIEFSKLTSLKSFFLGKDFNSSLVYYNNLIYTSFTSNTQCLNTSGNVYKFYNDDDLLLTIPSNNASLDSSKCIKFDDLLKLDYSSSDSDSNTTFEQNSIHEISKKLLGEDIPEEFSFVYLISDYLIALMIVVCLCCPFIFIVKLMKGDW